MVQSVEFIVAPAKVLVVATEQLQLPLPSRTRLTARSGGVDADRSGAHVASGAVPRRPLDENKVLEAARIAQKLIVQVGRQERGEVALHVVQEPVRAIAGNAKGEDAARLSNEEVITS